MSQKNEFVFSKMLPRFAPPHNKLVNEVSEYYFQSWSQSGTYGVDEVPQADLVKFVSSFDPIIRTYQLESIIDSTTGLLAFHYIKPRRDEKTGRFAEGIYNAASRLMLQIIVKMINHRLVGEEQEIVLYQMASLLTPSVEDQAEFDRQQKAIVVLLENLVFSNSHIDTVSELSNITGERYGWTATNAPLAQLMKAMGKHNVLNRVVRIEEDLRILDTPKQQLVDWWTSEPRTTALTPWEIANIYLPPLMRLVTDNQLVGEQKARLLKILQGIYEYGLKNGKERNQLKIQWIWIDNARRNRYDELKKMLPKVGKFDWADSTDIAIAKFGQLIAPSKDSDEPSLISDASANALAKLVVEVYPDHPVLEITKSAFDTIKDISNDLQMIRKAVHLSRMDLELGDALEKGTE